MQERVIGAGLKVLEKNEDGAVAKEMFYMFAVTQVRNAPTLLDRCYANRCLCSLHQEDFVHPIAVLELLWRSCCASELAKEEGSLASRLKVRQLTQLLVDHSLLLGSIEGSHVHDIIKEFLRKRLSAQELRELHRKVFDGMVAASQARLAATGTGLQDTGSTARPHDGEEVDWVSELASKCLHPYAVSHHIHLFCCVRAR